MPIASFPGLAPDSILSLATISESLMRTALAFRPDLAAAQLREQAAAKRTAGAINLERPQIDLNFSIGYSGLDQNSRFSSYVSPFSKNIPGLNAIVQVQSELPLKNLAAQGARRQFETNGAKLRILTEQTIRAIRSGVALALSTAINSLRQRQCASLSVESYRQAVENEKAKLVHRMSTIIDLISLEDRLTGSMLTQIQSEVALAQALVSLRFETGTLAVPEGKDFLVDIPSLSAFVLPKQE